LLRLIAAAAVAITCAVPSLPDLRPARAAN
jgi:hypothetical protein